MRQQRGRMRERRGRGSAVPRVPGATGRHLLPRNAPERAQPEGQQARAALTGA